MTATLDTRIAAFARLLASRDTARGELAAAEEELRQAIVAAVLPGLPGLCSPVQYGAGGNYPRGVIVGEGALLLESGTFVGRVTPLDLARVLADLIDRQLAGNLPTRVEELRTQATLMRGLAGALEGMRAAARPKKGR